MLYLAFALQYDQFDYCEDANAQKKKWAATPSQNKANENSHTPTEFHSNNKVSKV